MGNKCTNQATYLKAVPSSGTHVQVQQKQKREPSFTSQKLYFNDQTSFIELI